MLFGAGINLSKACVCEDSCEGGMILPGNCVRVAGVGPLEGSKTFKPKRVKLPARSSSVGTRSNAPPPVLRRVSWTSPK